MRLREHRKRPRVAHFADLSDAAEAGDSAAVEALLAQHPDDAAAKDSALLAAAERGHRAIATALLAAGASPDAADASDGWTPLLHSASRGDARLVEALLSAGADAQRPDARGTTPLLAACKAGAKGAVDALLSAGARAECRDADGWTPLLLAAFSGFRGVVRRLLRNGASPNDDGGGSWSALYCAAQNGHSRVAAALIAAGAAVDAPLAETGATPLFVAAQRGHSKVVDVLLSAGADAEAAARTGATPLVAAVAEGHVDCAERIARAGGRVPQQWRALVEEKLGAERFRELLALSFRGRRSKTKRASSAAAAAVAAAPPPRPHPPQQAETKATLTTTTTPRTPVLVRLRGLRPPPVSVEPLKSPPVIVRLSLPPRTSAAAPEKAAAGESPDTAEAAADSLPFSTRRSLGSRIWDAARHGDNIELEQLLPGAASGDSNWANAANKGWTPLFVSCFYGHLAAAELLVVLGNADVELACDGWTPLMISSANDFPLIVRLLLQHRATIDRGLVPFDTSSLWIACDRGNAEVARVLLSAGADKDRPDADGCTPLSAACKNGHKEAAIELIRTNADVNRADKSGWAPLYRATFGGFLDVAEVLVRAGADLNQADAGGVTPLSIAAKSGRKEIAEFLLAEGADRNKPLNNGATPLTIACANGHIEIAESIARAGGTIPEKWISFAEGKVGKDRVAFFQQLAKASAAAPELKPLLSACSSVADVVLWLKSINLEALSEVVTANEINGRAMLELSADDLLELGVCAFGHRKALLAAIRDVAGPVDARCATAEKPSLTAVSLGALAARFLGGRVVGEKPSRFVDIAPLFPPDFLSRPKASFVEALQAARIHEAQEVADICLDAAKRASSMQPEETAAVVLCTFSFGDRPEEVRRNPQQLLNNALADRGTLQLFRCRDLLFKVLSSLRRLPRFTAPLLYCATLGHVSPEDYAKEKHVCWHGFTSASTQPDAIKALLPAETAATLFVLHNAWGYDLQQLSFFAAAFPEKEVLLEPEIDFRVIDASQNGDLLTVELEMQHDGCALLQNII